MDRAVARPAIRFPDHAMLDHLTDIAHVEPLPASRALHEVICLGFGDAVSVLTRVRHP
jgi:hypothetical protein